MNFKVLNNFISLSEQEEIKYFSSCSFAHLDIENEHIRKVFESTKGWSVLCDFTKTEVSQSVARFQGDATLVEQVPSIYHELASRIATTLGISSDHVFFQYIVIGKHGKVAAHYDAGIPGYVTYKCNVCIEGPEIDPVYIDKNKLEIAPLDLYCFEASLYRHWMDSHEDNRIHLSYGFLLPYEDLNWEQDSPRIRLSNKIWRAYIDR